MKWFDSKYAGKRAVQTPGKFDRNDLKQNVKIRTFRTDKPEDMKDLENIYNQAAKGKVMVGAEEKQWVPGVPGDPLRAAEGNYWMIFLRWVEISVEPKEAYRTEGVNLDVSSQHPAEPAKPR